MIQGIIFDLWGTIIYSSHGHFETANCWSAASYLKSQGFILRREAFRERFLALRQEDVVADDLRQQSATRGQLNETAQAFGVELDAAILQSAERAFVMPEAAGATPIPGTLKLIQSLQMAGVRLGIASNTHSHLLNVVTLEHIGLSGVFNPVVTSVSCGFRKPSSRIFEAILRDWGIAPASVVMIGDQEDKDIRGAKAAGLRSILLTADSSKAMVASEADAVATDSEDIAQILQGWGLGLEE